MDISKAALEARKTRYKRGTRVELVSMDDPYDATLKPGDRGSVMAVDSTGTVHVSWDNGSTLGLVYGVDEIKPTKNDVLVHALRGDIQTEGMVGLDKQKLRQFLGLRYANPDNNITLEEFNRILDEEYAKVERWRSCQDYCLDLDFPCPMKCQKNWTNDCKSYLDCPPDVSVNVHTNMKEV